MHTGTDKIRNEMHARKLHQLGFTGNHPSSVRIDWTNVVFALDLEKLKKAVEPVKKATVIDCVTARHKPIFYSLS